MVPSIGGSKGPCVPWKPFQEELPTVELLREWDRHFHPVRWGLVTGRLSGVVVVDFDGDDGRKWMDLWGIAPHLRTGSGGYHWYATHPGWRVPTLNAKTGKNTWPWQGVDVRGDGGFAVVLGRNADGPYVQLRELNPEPFELLPEEFRNFLREHGEEDALSKRVASPRPPVGSERVNSQVLIDRALELARHGRNDSGFWLACQFRDNGYGLAEAQALAIRGYLPRVRRTNTRGKVEPYTERELKASFKEAYSRSARDPWKTQDPLPHEDSGLAMPPTKQPVPLSADNPDNLYLYVDHTGEPLVDHTGEPLSKQTFSRIPDEVTRDRRLRPRDVRVYSVLAGAHRMGPVSLGKRLLAKRSNCAERKVLESLKTLEAAGHIRKQPTGRGQRAHYVLLSPVFRPKAGGPGGTSTPGVPRRQPRAAVVSMPRRAGHQ
jgi:hypothetical protein